MSSTFLLTVLLMVGLVSFLRSSVKDRTTEMLFKSKTLDSDELLRQVRDYLTGRAYEVEKLDRQTDSVTLAGQVKPSIFLAIFLVGLATVGFGCLGLVLKALIPEIGDLWWCFVPIAPLVGIFYWRGADRREEISLSLRSDGSLWMRGHKDELTELKQALDLERLE
ncbi:cofactor assembly of complex C subunit B [Pseudanabaena sp. PCC 6802]|uniref:cofactor assembly of complex C subunit B n=1 Tax=Pseudanabaena sp. PCC 6802 TaxID=118173 RepID=UPI0021F0B0EE|nr:cofactor assembly of complex C subunit B [Pseudanabaena sp. PCC 6802]